MATNNSANIGIVSGGAQTYTFPTATDTLVGRASTDALTNKTITVTAGTTGIAPIVIPSGVALTTTKAGAIEHHGGHLYFTDVDSGTRYQLDQQSGSSITISSTPITSGTAGRILFEGTGNVVSESANLFFDATNNRLGIGKTPAYPLDIVGDMKSSTGFRFGSNAYVLLSGNDLLWYNSLNNIIAQDYNNGDLIYMEGLTGNVGIGTPVNTAPTSRFQVSQATYAGPGTVSNTAGGTTVTGVSTQFLNTFKVGDSITIPYTAGQTVVISAIASNTSMTTASITAANSGVSYAVPSGGIKFVVRGNGNVGIGTTNPQSLLDLSDTALAGSSSLAGSIVKISQTWNTTGSPTAFLLNATNTASGANALIADFQLGGVSKFKVDKLGQSIFISGSVQINDNALTPTLIQCNANLYTSAVTRYLSGTTSAYFGLDGTGLYGFAAGAIMMTSSAHPAMIATNGLERIRVLSGGNTGFGLTVPTAILHIAAGTATASTAPLKLTAGTNLATTEAGAIEYDGTHLYFTVANAGTRYQLDQQGGTGANALGTYIVQTATNAPANGQVLATLATGLVKNTTTTGILSIAVNSDLPAMSATVGGAVPTPPNNTTTFLRGDGTWATPAGGSGITRNVSSTAVDVTAGAAASTDYVIHASGAITITLPTAVGNTNKYTIIRTGISTVYIATTASQLINGVAAPLNLITQYASVDLISDNTGWYIH